MYLTVDKHAYLVKCKQFVVKYEDNGD